MADLGEALRGFLELGWSGAVPSWPPDRVQLAAAMDAVEAEYPTRRAAARAAGVGVETWRRWRLGVQLPSARKRLGFVDRVAVVGGWAKFRRGEWVIRATVRVSNDVRPRTLHVGKHMRPETLAAVVAAAKAGDWEVAISLVWHGIQVEYRLGEGVSFPAGDVSFEWETVRRGGG